MSFLRSIRLVASALALVVTASSVAAFEMEWVTIGAPGNPADDETMICCDEAFGLSGFGAVDAVYRIGKFEVTVAQWTELLNAVAADDPNGLYNDGNGDRFMSIWITRSGSSGSYTYAPVEGQAQKPIGFLDFFDTLRFANWLHNGQPTGAQDATTTEDGSYTLTGRFEPPDVTRNPGGRVFLSSEDEWYKAAYYDPPSQSYFRYPTGSDAAPLADLPPGGPDSAAIANPRGCVDPDTNLGPCESVEVGAYPEASSPFGTFGQAGNHFEWNESIYFEPITQTPDRGFRGGWWRGGSNETGSFIADNIFPDCENCRGLSFRVTAVPEASRLLSGGAALTMMGVLAWRGRRAAA